MRVVFNDDDKKNLKRIEDGIYPEKVPPALHATNILQQACPPKCPLLKTWLETKACVDTHFQKDHHDPETRAMVIVDDRSFIVLTETKFSFRCIPVWDRYSPHRTRVEKKKHM